MVDSSAELAETSAAVQCWMTSQLANTNNVPLIHSTTLLFTHYLINYPLTVKQFIMCCIHYKSNQRLHTSAKENILWIWSIRTLDGSRWLPCPQIQLWQNFHKNPITLSRDISQIVEKWPILWCWRILQKIPGSGSANGWFPKFNKFSLTTYIYGKIFVKIRSVVFRKVANRQTNGQTDKQHYITSLADVNNAATSEQRWAQHNVYQ